LCLDSPRVEIAVLDTRTSAVLRHIEGMFSVRFTIFNNESIRATTDEADRQGLPHQDMLHLAIGIYSPKKFTTAIRKELSKARFYLQPPYRLEERDIYENPHEFKSNRQTVGYLSRHPDHSTQQSLPDIQAPTADIPKRDQQTSLVEQVLQVQIQSRTVQQADADSRITTPLLPHQKEALYFVLERERGVVNNGLSLWKTEGTQRKPCYRHSIHNFRTAKLPQESRGGILADEMGLGKTLSLISAIVTTLDEAKIFSSRQGQRNNAASPPQSQPTLVITISLGSKYLQ
jgi:SWI/SNF-related matrix-associated actin-dependent regulator of chromatin subfamily A3